MINAAVLLALAALGTTSGISGLAMLGIRRCRPSATLSILAGLVFVVAAVLDASGNHDAALLTFIAGAGLLFPLALITYPRLTLRHPVDFVAVVTVAGAGALALFWPADGPENASGSVSESVSGNVQVLSSMGLVIGSAVIAYTWWRIERASEAERRALIWMSLAVAVSAIAVFVAVFLRLGTAGAVGALIVSCGIGPALCVGVRRPELVDVRGLVVRLVVFVTAAVGYVALFVTIESLVEILGANVAPVGALAVIGALVATTFHPMQVVLRGVIDELLFGARPDPLGAATRVAGHIGDDPVLALRAIREALVLPYAALSVDGGLVAASGDPVSHTRAIVLGLGEDRFGELVIGLRPGDLALTGGDENVLSLVAPLFAQTLRATALAGELRDSRGRAIGAIEEERRRLRRDLHDGLGPRLSGIAFGLDAVRNTFRSDPENAESQLTALRQETATAIEEIRGLVYAMRPPALDELGLVPALRQRAQALRTADGAALQVALYADPLPSLPAAVEVAAYRIVTEALTNTARHAGCGEATVRLSFGEAALEIEIIDTGPADSRWRAGVGLASMRERAAELGGTFSAGGTNSGGRVRAVLPLS